MIRGAHKHLLSLLALGMAVFAAYHVVQAGQSLPPQGPPEEPARSPYGRTLAGAGVVEAQTENIAVGSSLPGVVLEVFVPSSKVGTRAQAGTPLFRVDDRHLRAQLASAKAALAASEAQLARLQVQPRPEELPPSRAKVRHARATAARTQDRVERARRLQLSRAIPEEEHVERVLAHEGAKALVEQAEAEHALLVAGAWEADKAVARAAVAQARAQVRQIETEIDRALVRAPVDGEVLQVNVRPGEAVGTQPGTALVVLGNARRLHVRVDIDESDIPHFRPGLPARASSRGDSSVAYPLQFVRVEPFVVPKRSLTGDNTERVDTRVLQVVYALEQAEGAVYVGQQLDVFLDRAAESPPTARR